MAPRTILVADDDRHLRESLVEMLVGLGCQALPAANGNAAMTELSRTRFSLLLSDVDMPDVSGFQLIAWAQERGCADRCALMSARTDALLSTRAHEAGAVAMLAKPVALRHLSTLLTNAFGPA